MLKQVNAFVEESILERISKIGYSKYKAVQEGLNLLLEREDTKAQLKELRTQVNEQKFKLDRIIKEQQKLEFGEKPLSPKQAQALRGGENVPPMSKMANAQPTDTIPSEENICKKIWSGKVFMGSGGYLTNWDFTLTEDAFDELYTRARKFNREIARILHDHVHRDYSGTYVGLDFDTVHRIDRLLGVNSFSDDKTVGV